MLLDKDYKFLPLVSSFPWFLDSPTCFPLGWLCSMPRNTMENPTRRFVWNCGNCSDAWHRSTWTLVQTWNPSSLSVRRSCAGNRLRRSAVGSEDSLHHSLRPLVGDFLSIIWDHWNAVSREIFALALFPLLSPSSVCEFKTGKFRYLKLSLFN